MKNGKSAKENVRSPQRTGTLAKRGAPFVLQKVKGGNGEGKMTVKKMYDVQHYIS